LSFCSEEVVGQRNLLVICQL